MSIVAKQLGEYHGANPGDLNRIVNKLLVMEISAEWRDPYHNDMIHARKNDIAKRWHHDDYTSAGELILWSNHDSTEVMDAETKEILPRFPDGAIIWINNRTAMHRMPPVIRRGRYFARFWNVQLKNPVVLPEENKEVHAT